VAPAHFGRAMGNNSPLPSVPIWSYDIAFTWLCRISWLRRLRIESPLGYKVFLSGLKLSEERDGGLGLARFSAVCPLGDHMCANGLLWHVWHVARRYGRCCMYGPNYVKLSRVFAVKVFSMAIGHYTALLPVRFDPHWSHSHDDITASIRLCVRSATAR
jgi:hypothetical protein